MVMSASSQRKMNKGSRVQSVVNVNAENAGKWQGLRYRENVLARGSVGDAQRRFFLEELSKVWNHFLLTRCGSGSCFGQGELSYGV